MNKVHPINYGVCTNSLSCTLAYTIYQRERWAFILTNLVQLFLLL